MDQQASAVQTPVSQPVPSAPVAPLQPNASAQTQASGRKSRKYLWLVAGIIVLFIGVGIGILLRH